MSLEQIVEAITLSLPVASSTFIITTSSLFKPIRDRVENAAVKAKWLEFPSAIIHCPLCCSVWVAAVFTSLFGTQSWWLTMFGAVTLANLLMGGMQLTVNTIKQAFGQAEYLEQLESHVQDLTANAEKLESTLVASSEVIKTLRAELHRKTVELEVYCKTRN